MLNLSLFADTAFKWKKQLSTKFLSISFRSRGKETLDILRTPSARHKRRSIRSGYAFAHQEGFGRLITSGKIMKPLPKVALASQEEDDSLQQQQENEIEDSNKFHPTFIL